MGARVGMYCILFSKKTQGFELRPGIVPSLIRPRAPKGEPDASSVSLLTFANFEASESAFSDKEAFVTAQMCFIVSAPTK